VLLGDQVYADSRAEVFNTSTKRERFSERYHEALGRTGLADVLRNSASILLADDHEIYDSYADSASLSPVTKERVNWAKEAFLGFQCATRLNSPLLGRSNGDSNVQSFDFRGLRFLFVDTRLDRVKNGNSRLLFGDFQRKEIDTVFAEVKRNNEKVLVVGSGSVFFPILNSSLVNALPGSIFDDSWWGFPAECEWFLGKLVESGLEKVLFLSGDAHCSMRVVGDVSINGKTVSFDSIACSALYAPYPFANSTVKDYCMTTSPAFPQGITLNGFKMSWKGVGAQPDHKIGRFATVDFSKNGAVWKWPFDVTFLPK
jgi:cholesterol oxidase